MNITLFETNKKKLVAIRNKVQMIAGNLNDEIRILMNKKDDLEKCSLSVDGNNIMIEELSHVRDRIFFLKSQEDNLQHILRTI